MDVGPEDFEFVKVVNKRVRKPDGHPVFNGTGIKDIYGRNTIYTRLTKSVQKVSAISKIFISLTCCVIIKFQSPPSPPDSEIQTSSSLSMSPACTNSVSSMSPTCTNSVSSMSPSCTNSVMRTASTVVVSSSVSASEPIFSVGLNPHVSAATVPLSVGSVHAWSL